MERAVRTRTRNASSCASGRRTRARGVRSRAVDVVKKDGGGRRGRDDERVSWQRTQVLLAWASSDRRWWRRARSI